MLKRKRRCIDPKGIGRLLEDAKAGRLDTDHPHREKDRQLFIDEHLKRCRSCYEAMLDHANDLAFKHVASELGISVEEVQKRFCQQMDDLAAKARQTNVPLEAMIKGRR